jgi:hypothetical protein
MSELSAYCKCRNPIPNDLLDYAKCTKCSTKIHPGKYFFSSFGEEGFEVLHDGNWNFLEQKETEHKIKKMRFEDS